MTLRYSHLSQSHMEHAVDVLGKRIKYSKDTQKTLSNNECSVIEELESIKL